LKASNINVNSTRKINDHKIYALKVERVPNTFENLNSFEMMLKMLKTMQIYQKCIFLGFHCFFAIFWFFLKNYQNMGQKLGSNRCPLFTMLTKQDSSMFCIVSFVKKNLSFCLLNLHNIHSSKDVALFSLFSLPSLFFLFFLSFFLSLFFFCYLEIPSGDLLSQNQRMCVAWST